MATSDARIEANKKNAARSTGPKTEAGKEKSRQNSLKHGMTGAGVVLLEKDAAEVARRTEKYAGELAAIGDVGQALARRVALNSVRMERLADQQAAALGRWVRQCEAEFVLPEDVDAEEADRLRVENARIAMFDPSKEASLARQYEASAERSFYRAVKHLRQMELQAEALLKAEEAAIHQANVNEMMGSIFATQRAARQMDDKMDALYPELGLPIPRQPANLAQITPAGVKVDVPLTIGRSR
jgi:hypothetical protein